MSRAELKQWAKKKIKGHIWELLIPLIVAGILSSLTIGQKIIVTDEGWKINGGINLSLFFYFVQVGLAYFMVHFIKDKEHEFKDLFRFINDYVRIFVVGLLSTIFIALWALLLIIPGIIKAIAYSMIPLLLADDKYKDLGYMEVLKKSEEMMKGHKMDYFVLGLSYIGWHILAIFTLGLLEIWIVPYQETATYRFLSDIKDDYEKLHGMSKEEEKAPAKK